MARRNKSRGDGEGSIYQRNDGLWVAQVTFVGADGERKKLTRMAGTQSEARRLLTDLKAKQDAGKLVVSPRIRPSATGWIHGWSRTSSPAARRAHTSAITRQLTTTCPIASGASRCASCRN